MFVIIGLQKESLNQNKCDVVQIKLAVSYESVTLVTSSKKMCKCSKDESDNRLQGTEIKRAIRFTI